MGFFISVPRVQVQMHLSFLKLLLSMQKYGKVLLDMDMETLTMPSALKRHVHQKVSKFQKQIFLLSFEPKKEQNYFSISTLRI